MAKGRALRRSDRWAAGVRRRLWSMWYRFRYQRVGFGPGCDIRQGCFCVLGAEGEMRVGEKAILDRRFTAEVSGLLKIGDRVIFGHSCTLAAMQEIEIGADTMIGEMVSIRDHDHAFADLDRPIREQGAVIAPVSIGRDVWIGGKATLLKGVRVGDQAVIGANAVVTTDIPERAIAVGVPARVIGYRAEVNNQLNTACMDTEQISAGGVA